MNIFEVIFLFKISKDLKKLLQKLSQLFEKVVAPDKFTSTVWNRYSWFCQNCDLSFFCHICKYFWGNVQFLQCFQPPQKRKNYHSFLKWVWHTLNLLAYFRIYSKISNNIVILVVLWRFSNIFKIMFTFYNFCIPETTQNCYRSLKQVWYKPNLLLLFKIHVTVFDKIVFYITYCKLRGMFCPDLNIEL